MESKKPVYLVVLRKLTEVDMVPFGRMPQLAGSQARDSMLPELSMMMRMLGVVTLVTNGGEAV
jgi:hypothetical protein